MIIIIDPDGRKLGDMEACAELAGIDNPKSFGSYQRSRRPKNNPAPLPVRRDMVTGSYLTDLDEVAEWAARRARRGAKEKTS